MNFNRVILSSNDNPKFIDFWPLIAKSWRQLFGDIEVWLALVAPFNRFDMKYISQHGYVERYDPVRHVPTSNQAKVARYFLAAAWGDKSINMTSDLDLMPLQTTYLHSLLQQRPPGHLLTVGSELYTGAEVGKFPAGYLTAESSVWRRLVNPMHYYWHDFVHSFVGFRVIDHKEDICRTVHHEDPDCFSDESLLRALLTLKLNAVPVFHAARGFDPYTVRALCRSDWKFDPKKLADGTYVEAHLPRPLTEHGDKLQPLLNHINGIIPTHSSI